MLLFYIVIAVMTLFALALLLPPLLRAESPESMDQQQINVNLAREQLALLTQLRDQKGISQADFEVRQEEIALTLASSMEVAPGTSNTIVQDQKTGLSGRWMALVVGALLPVGAGLVYLQIGNPATLDPEFIASQSVAASVDDKLPPIEELLPRLEAHLQEQPDDIKGWKLLGVTYLRLQRFSDADAALSNALALDKDNADLMLQLADAKAMLAGGQLAGEPEQLVRRALSLDPSDLRGQWMMGMAKRQNKEYAEAISVWEQLLPALSDQPQAIAEVNQLITETRLIMSGDTPAQTGIIPPAADSAAAPVNVAIQVQVTLDPALADRVLPEQVLYVYAKAVQGPPMPLAVMKLKASELPLTVTLDDSMAMVPQMKLSAFSEVVVGARISRSGNPVAESGDLFEELSPVSVIAGTSITINITRTVP